MPELKLFVETAENLGDEIYISTMTAEQLGVGNGDIVKVSIPEENFTTTLPVQIDDALFDFVVKIDENLPEILGFRSMELTVSPAEGGTVSEKHMPHAGPSTSVTPPINPPQVPPGSPAPPSAPPVPQPPGAPAPPSAPPVPQPPGAPAPPSAPPVPQPPGAPAPPSAPPVPQPPGAPAPPVPQPPGAPAPPSAPPVPQPPGAPAP
ncbi:MAG: hypothetical protein ACTSXU_04560, partial [Promethearchaeota archaeon]